MFKGFAAAMALGTLTLFASAASATDGKIYGGETCSFEGGSLTGWEKYSNNFKNTSTGTTWTACSAVREIASGTINYGYLEINGSAPSAGRIVAKNRSWGTTAYYSGALHGSSPHYYYTWGQLSPSAYSNYRFELQLPANSSVEYYRLDEI
jgi:hypothetical protein